MQIHANSWIFRDQAEEIELDWEIRTDKDFYSESAASGYINEALNLSVDDFGKIPSKSMKIHKNP